MQVQLRRKSWAWWVFCCKAGTHKVNVAPFPLHGGCILNGIKFDSLVWVFMNAKNVQMCRSCMLARGVQQQTLSSLRSFRSGLISERHLYPGVITLFTCRNDGFKPFLMKSRIRTPPHLEGSSKIVKPLVVRETLSISWNSLSEEVKFANTKDNETTFMSRRHNFTHVSKQGNKSFPSWGAGEKNNLERVWSQFKDRGSVGHWKIVLDVRTDSSAPNAFRLRQQKTCICLLSRLFTSAWHLPRPWTVQIRRLARV